MVMLHVSNAEFYCSFVRVALILHGIYVAVTKDSQLRLWRYICPASLSRGSLCSGPSAQAPSSWVTLPFLGRAVRGEGGEL